ncbi:MAG TPA: YIP1 family protein [Chthoniobacteraceae bacterium]|jgi:hypothetical protein|nr:YIP1 family protein [Chthoniobacteraceae bacterium]
MIHIGRARTLLGQYTEDEARDGLSTGRFSPTDLGWKEGMENWAPLSQFPELTAPPAPLPPLPPAAGEPPYPPDAPLAEEGLPWEIRGSRGPFLSFLATARLVLFSPREAFTRMLKQGHMAGALLYNLIGGWIGLVAASGYAVLATKLEGPPKAGTPFAQYYQSPEMTESGLRTFCVMGPVVVTLIVLGAAVLAHLFLVLTGGANRPFHVTLRVLCYSFGSAFLLYLFPIFGGPVALGWLAFCCIVGLRVAHDTTTARAVATVVLMGAAGLAGIIGLFMLASAAGGMGN